MIMIMIMIMIIIMIIICTKGRGQEGSRCSGVHRIGLVSEEQKTALSKRRSGV